jgi:hypothetical protein
MDAATHELQSILLLSGVVFFAFYAMAYPFLKAAGVRPAAHLAKGVTALLGLLWRLAFVAIATMVDALITASLSLYHAASVVRAGQVADDWAGFLQRLNDRVLSVVVR